MSGEALLAVGIVLAVIAALASNRVGTVTAMVGGLVLLILAGSVEPQTAFGGFAHPAVVAICALFVVARGLWETGATMSAGPPLLGRPKSIAVAQLRLMVPVALLSAFINNTPVVAMYLPIVREWAKRVRISPSKLFIPLSFSSQLGGQLTLIGSASNLIVMELYLEYLASEGLGAPSHAYQFWGPAYIGLPVAIIGIVYLIAASPKLLPDRIMVPETVRYRSYTAQMEVLPGSVIAHSTIESSGLLQFQGLYLFQLQRGGYVIAKPSPDTALQAGDRLGFVGNLEPIIDLQQARGVVPVQRQDTGPVSHPATRELVQVVIAVDSPFVGQTVRDLRLRPVYDAAIVAVHRNKTSLENKIGDIVIQAGDTLLLETRRGFWDRHRSSSDFSLVSTVSDFKPQRYDRLKRSLFVFGLFLTGMLALPVDPVVVCLCAALLMVILGCLPMGRALASIDLQVVVAIGAALGMSYALQQTGAAEAISHWLLDACSNLGVGNRGMLFIVTLTASAFAQVITQNGAAALAFPIAMATARELEIHPEPFAFCLIVGANLSFLSPVAYQANLMVFGPGGYRFLDFPRLGLGLTILLSIVCALVAPAVFPFRPLP